MGVRRVFGFKVYSRGHSMLVYPGFHVVQLTRGLFLVGWEEWENMREAADL